jgi:hypothetical protein
MDGVGGWGCEGLGMQQILQKSEGSAAEAFQKVPTHCELEMVKFALQRAMQEAPFGLRGDRKACKFVDVGSSLVGLILM